MPKVERRLIVYGNVYVVECAVSADGSSPASDMLDELEAGHRLDDPDHLDEDDWPDAAQTTDFYKLLALIKHFADNGVPPFSRAINELNDGVWEFKRGAKRVSFFDTDGTGGYEPKRKIANKADAAAQDDYWWCPDFDDYLRLGHCFMKAGATATADDLTETIRIREEDLAYDHNSEGAQLDA